MVNIKSVRESNLAFKLSGHASGLVAVFVGATSGIGKGTLKQFAKYAQAPKVYILGRSKKAAHPLLDELQASNPQSKFEFIETEISLMKNVDLACDQIKANEKKVDILFTSPGYLSFDSRKESVEGMDIPHALRYYTRLRFAYNLIPLLLESPNPRVVSILAGGQESEIDINDLEVRNDFSFIKAAKNGTTQTTLAFEELAKSYPSISFLHKYPGFVNTGVIARLLSTAPGIFYYPAALASFLVLPILNLFSTSEDEAGERGLFLVTSARYPPAKPKTEFVGVEVQGIPVATASVVKDGQGNGVYRLTSDDESAPESPVLPGYRLDHVDKTVWEETVAAWDRALEKST
ncbi:uncharacterized protein LY89DRAFT_739170 [Mollisia scopiformis]|uniref:Uncharacterized protein n=1 Tax=Mollisia scopiformis TaxID=149040 RepID=A0A194WVQ2_MOLSC|nr:uncharacterized protein LY89DRAFT_739170 [Mollisia scopiformis]KUJ11754.1 hypothetical protein LY89DRAFT_739170 [Mollisia scopiformis]